MTRFALWCMQLAHALPLSVLRAAGSALGALLWVIARERRTVAETNLRLCFPDMPAAERSATVRATFRHFCQSVIDRAILWHGPAARIRALVQVEGEAHLTALAGTPVILLAPHFVGLDAAWARLTLDRRMLSMYARQKNAAFNEALRRGRTRFNEPVLLSRQDGVRGILRELAGGLPLYYLPDMDFGARDAVFAPFFGVPAATVTAVSRLARLANAVVLPVVTRMTPDGYVVTIHPAWTDYPGTDDAADAARMNAFIETEARRNLAQYHWLHKRFKTRPAGAPRFY